jgi:hypothetical protein
MMQAQLEYAATHYVPDLSSQVRELEFCPAFVISQASAPLQRPFGML